MNKEDFDRVFDAAFEEAARNHLPSPDPDPSWSKIETILKERHAKRKFRPLPYAVAASFLIGAFILGSPTVTKAFNPFVQTIKNIQAGVVSFIFGNDQGWWSERPTCWYGCDPIGNIGVTILSVSICLEEQTALH